MAQGMVRDSREQMAGWERTGIFHLAFLSTMQMYSRHTIVYNTMRMKPRTATQEQPSNEKTLCISVHL